jgi:hypothetical protein
MKKGFKYYAIVWAALLALFNVIAFVSVGWIGYEKYTASFWIGYVFITISFLGQLGCAWYALKESNLQKVFYNISLITTSYIGLILSFIFGGLCMLISPLPYWIGVLLCSALLAFNVIAVVKASAAVDLVSAVDEKIKVQTFFIKSLTIDTECLMAKAKSAEVKAACKKVYEAVRYSDPMSNNALASLENQITILFAKLSEAVLNNNAEMVSAVAEDLLILLAERNKKCRLLK